MLIAYSLREEFIHDQISNLQIEIPSLDREITNCDLSVCKGMCCYDGIYLDEQSASIIQEVVNENREYFSSIGIDLPQDVTTIGEWNGNRGIKTATKYRNFSKDVEDYPKHFEDTCCVFLTDQGECSLQKFSEYKGFHKWYYKPVGCWLHPIGLNNEKVFVMYDEQNDPTNIGVHYPGFVCHTLCGKTVISGQKGIDCLQEELSLLNSIAENDVLKQYINKY